MTDESKKDDAKPDEVLNRAKEFFDKAKDAENDNRDRFLDDLRFARMGEQWPDSAKKSRELDGRPCLTFNKMPSFIRQVVNDSRQNKPAINILPVGKDSDKDTAQVLEGLVRNIEVTSAADIAYDTAIDNAVTGGIGYIRINLDYSHNDAFDLDICIDQVSNPMTIYADYNSKKSDGSDWMQALVTEWITKDEYKAKYPKADLTDWEVDFREAQAWIEDESVLVAEYWEREEVDRVIYQLSNGQVVDEDFLSNNADDMAIAGIMLINHRISKAFAVTQYILSGAEVLETNKWAGQYIPIVPVYGDEVNEDGKRHFYGLIHQARGAQESYNYWRTSAVEKVALDSKSPVIGSRGTFNTDSDKWATLNSKNHATIEFDGPNPPFRLMSNGVPAGDIQMALSAADDMKSIIGIYDASLGARSNETSGKAIMARQREGDVSTYHFIDNMSRAIRQIGKIIIDLIPKIYTTERIVRVLAEDGTPNEVQINQAFIQNGVQRMHDLTIGKYDVVVKSGPSFTSRREESATQMMQLLQARPEIAPIIGDLIAKNLDWPGADEIGRRLQAMLPPQIQGLNPAVQQVTQQFQQQIEQVQQRIEQGKAELDKLQQENNTLKLSVKDKSNEALFKAKELELKEKELELKALETQADLQEKAAELKAKAFEFQNQQLQAQANESAMALMDFAPMMDKINAIQEALLMKSAESERPKIKRARAIKQPDGSWAMEAIETNE
jgi:hypothetical protein